MKHGANHLSPIHNTLPKKQKITKTMDVLLEEVNTGNFDDFRSFLIQKNITALYLRENATKIDLTQLSLALNETQVHSLDLRRNDIGDEGAASFNESLKGTKIHTLNLEFNKIGAIGAAKLGVALEGSQVHTLFLGDNNIGAEGAASLCKSLQNNTKVHTLNIESNNIGDDGAASLGAALKGTQVHTLGLRDNDIGANGAISLGTALKDTKVHTLDLSNNNIGSKGAVSLIKVLKGTHVHTLSLWFNDICPNNTAQLAACIPDTLLFDVVIVSNDGELEAALKKNHWEKRLPPYYIASLQHLPESEKQQYIDLPKGSAETELQFAGGIFMMLGQRGLPELQNEILNHLPSVNPQLTHQYQLATAKAASKTQATNIQNTDVDIKGSFSIR